MIAKHLNFYGDKQPPQQLASEVFPLDSRASQLRTQADLADTALLQFPLEMSQNPGYEN